MTHQLDISTQGFYDILGGKKNFDIQKNSHNFHENDQLIFREFEDGEYTGNELMRWVGYIQHGDGTNGLAEGWCILALKRSAPMEGIDGDF